MACGPCCPASSAIPKDEISCRRCNHPHNGKDSSTDKIIRTMIVANRAKWQRTAAVRLCDRSGSAPANGRSPPNAPINRAQRMVPPRAPGEPRRRCAHRRSGYCRTSAACKRRGCRAPAAPGTSAHNARRSTTVALARLPPNSAPAHNRGGASRRGRGWRPKTGKSGRSANRTFSVFAPRQLRVGEVAFPQPRRRDGLPPPARRSGCAQFASLVWSQRRYSIDFTNIRKCCLHFQAPRRRAHGRSGARSECGAPWGLGRPSNRKRGLKRQDY